MKRAWACMVVLLLSAIGRAAVGPEIPLAPAGGSGAPQLHVHLAYASNHLLAVWSDGQLRGSLDGSPLDLQVAGVPMSIIGVAAGGKCFLIAYQIEMNASPYFTPVLALRVGFDGHVLDPAPIAVDADTHGSWGGNIAYDGRDFVVVTMEKHSYPSIIWAETIVTGRVTEDGVAGGNVRLTSSSTSSAPRWPRIAWASDHFIIGYSAVFFGTEGISAFGRCAVALQLQESGNLVLPDCQFPDTRGQSSQSTVAVDPVRATLAWLDVTQRTATIDIAQTDLQGRPVLPPTAVAVAGAPEPIRGSDVEIAWDGTTYLVAWMEGGPTTDMVLRALHLTYGPVIERQPFDVSGAVAGDFSLIAVPQGFAIGYSRNDGGTVRAFMRFVDRAGELRRRRAVR